MKERKKEMLRLRHKKHWSLEMIGKRFGLSKQRIGQIIGPTGSISEIIERQEGFKNNTTLKSK